VAAAVGEPAVPGRGMLREGEPVPAGCLHRLRYRHHLARGEAGPPGWEIPAAIGVRCARPDKPVVAVVGDNSFQFPMEELAVAARYRIPFVIVMVHSEYPGQLRQTGLGYDVGDVVDGEGGIDHVKLMEAFGCPARRVERPGEIAGALRWATLEAEATQLPVLVEVMVEREADAALGASLDTITEFEPVPVLVPVEAP